MALNIPKNKIVTKYTSGGEYIVKDTNVPYQGYYCEVNNTLYAGKDYNSKAPILISKADQNQLLQNKNTAAYSVTSGITSQQLQQQKPTSLPNAYRAPNDTNPRFYCRKTNEQPIIIKQISEEDYKRLSNTPLYQTTYIGIYNNKNQSPVDANKQLPGLELYLKDSDVEGGAIPQNQTQPPPNRIGTDLDGINGFYTSQFTFPKAFLINLNTGNVKNLGLKGNTVLEKVNEAGITVQQMAEWNNFVGWMDQRGYTKNKNMDHKPYSKNVWEQYKKENPNFWINYTNSDLTSDDVRKVQTVMKAYRLYTIAVWKLGETEALRRGFKDLVTIEISGIPMNPKNPDDVRRVEQSYLSWAK
jgi:hypothetical protein